MRKTRFGFSGLLKISYGHSSIPTRLGIFDSNRVEDPDLRSGLGLYQVRCAQLEKLFTGIAQLSREFRNL